MARRLVDVNMKTKYVVIGIIVLIAIASLYLLGSFTGLFPGLFPSDESVGQYDDFAKCLAEKGVTMYGTKFCGACKRQKEMFGSSFQYVSYVECTEQLQLCSEKSIDAVPTWIIDGELYVGVKSLESLSSLSDCELS